MGVGSRARAAGARARGHRAGMSSVVFFWSERVRIQPRSRGKFFFFLAKINFFARRNWEKKELFV